jgi:hypothetical protein
MAEVIPPEWRFLFISEPHILEQLRSSQSIENMIQAGKLRLRNVQNYIKTWQYPNIDIAEVRSRILTNLTLYNDDLRGVEHALVFDSAAILCANGNVSINEYLGYDWVGAPW